MKHLIKNPAARDSACLFSPPKPGGQKQCSNTKWMLYSLFCKHHLHFQTARSVQLQTPFLRLAADVHGEHRCSPLLIQKQQEDFKRSVPEPVPLHRVIGSDSSHTSAALTSGHPALQRTSADAHDYSPRAEQIQQQV